MIWPYLLVGAVVAVLALWLFIRSAGGAREVEMSAGETLLDKDEVGRTPE